MELRHLRYFVAVARELNFTRAAERLHVAQPALSRQIKQLEDEIGIELFTRIKGRCYLSKAGNGFLEDAERVLAQAEESVQRAQKLERGEFGRLKIGYTGTLFYEPMPPILEELRKVFPYLAIDLFNLPPGPQCQAVLAGELNLGLISLPDEAIRLGLECAPVQTSRLLAMLPANHHAARLPSLDLKSLARDFFIVPSAKTFPGSSKYMLSICRKAGFVPKVLQEGDGPQTAISFVAAGCGVSVVPEPYQRLPHDGVVFRPLKPASTISFHAIWRGDQLSRVLTRCLEVVKKVCSRTPRRRGASSP